MKLVSFFALCFLLCCCEPGDNSNGLPAATTTGENTAGCLVDGKIFVPRGSGWGGPTLSCFYQYVDGGYRLGLSISNRTNDILKSVSVATNEQLVEGNTYFLIAKEDDGQNYTSNFGEFTIYSNVYEPNYFQTTGLNIGQLTITKLDPSQNIISGTFWFDAINESGEVTEIRDGRFDVHFAN